jgi:Zn-dependent M28 family amino/carboxypeptidase
MVAMSFILMPITTRLFAVLCLAGLAAAQNRMSPEMQLASQLVRIREAALTDDYAYKQLTHLTENIGSRPSGSPQAEAAVHYVAEELGKLGMEVRLEPVHVPQWQRGTETAELIDYPGHVSGAVQKVVVTALGGNVPTSAQGITAEVLAVSSFDQLKGLGRPRVAGKIVLFNVPFDQRKAAAGFWFEAYSEAVAYRVEGAKVAAEMGAAACLVRSVGNADYRLPHTGFSEPAGIPAGAVTAEDASLIWDLAGQGIVKMHLVLTSQNGPDVLSYNVVADLKGSEHPEQVVMVGGHLDSWDLGTGAIDDGAGVAVAMETAQLLNSLHLTPKRTIRVVAWMDEENGGRGHDTYAKDHAGEMANHIAAIESDGGAGHPLGFQAKISPVALQQLKVVQDVLQPVGANLINLTSEAPGADVAPLAKAGVPTMSVLQDGRLYFNYHHTAADTLDKVVPQELRENAAAMAVMGYALAQMPEPLPH